MEESGQAAQQSGTIIVHARTLEGSVADFPTSAETTVKELASLIAFYMRISDPVAILHNGRILDPYLTVGAQNVKDGDSIVLYLEQNAPRAQILRVSFCPLACSLGHYGPHASVCPANGQ